ncbi:MAG: phosphate ABC transporter substrate-binding protein [Ignavibacteria bacterium]|jgi:phosphate transport system substrate-binding protein|nr:phosphate ABC transporter substrate-binding protein [Ignavibacteria bacterium]MCU7504212.1 phosphate ABC transporter substrate-binding protein [Ignavibacteria bacterium]MCU7516057.1 phosphate ABC transporter substrate-binding protein [Ignavibacteria bacterium]
MLKKAVIASIVFVASIAAFGCGKSATSVTLAGSTAFQPFAERLAEQYMESHNGVNITVQGGGSAVGIQSANSGAAQIGMADMVQLPDEAKGLTPVIVARDGVAIVVNPKNPITNLTTEQVRDIFNGKITNWKQLGGNDAPITVVSREAGSGTRSSFEKIIGSIQLKKDALIQDSNGTIRETVSNDPNAVSYLSHGMINEKVKPLTLDGIQSSVENIVNGTYKLSRPIFLLVKGNIQGEIKNFIDYVLSPEGQKTIKDNGLLPAKS